MAHPIVLAFLVVLGMFTGAVINYIVGKMEKIKVLDTTLLYFFGEILYFTLLFSVPVSGNLVLSFIVFSIFLYALYGSFGAEKLPPKKDEDKVISKWFRNFP